MDLTVGNIPQLIRKIAIPASVGFFFNAMLNIVDTLFAGFISTEALASMSISFPIFFIIIAFNAGLSTGASALLANCIGAGRPDEGKRVFAQVLSFSVLMYCLIVPPALLFTPRLFQLLGAEGSYLIHALSFINVILVGSIFLILIYGANSILQAYGNTSILRNFLIFGFFLNAILDPWYLFGGLGIPSLGLPGIAAATVTVYIVGAMYIFYVVINEGYFSGLSFRDFIPKWHLMLMIAEQSIPASLNMMTIGIGVFVITYFIKDFGTAAVAAYGIVTRIEQIAMLPIIGLTIATLSIVGQNNGARYFIRVRHTINLTLLYSLITISFGSVAMLFIPKWLMAPFSTDKEVLAIGSQYLRIASLTSWAYIILFVNISALQGMKRPIYPVAIGVYRQIVAPYIVFEMVRYSRVGILGLWWGICLITWSGAIVTYIYTRMVLKKVEK